MNELTCHTPAEDVYSTCLSTLPYTGTDPLLFVALGVALVVVGLIGLWRT